MQIRTKDKTLISLNLKSHKRSLLSLGKQDLVFQPISKEGTKAKNAELPPLNGELRINRLSRQQVSTMNEEIGQTVLSTIQMKACVLLEHFHN